MVCDFIWFVDHWTFNTSSNCFKSLLKLMGQNSIVQSSYNTGNSTMLMCSVLIDVECRSRYCYSHSYRWEKLYLSRICLMIDRAKFGSSHFLPWPRIFITETYCFIKQTFFFHVFVWVYFVSLLKTSCFILLCLIFAIYKRGQKYQPPTPSVFQTKCNNSCDMCSTPFNKGYIISF